jgi:hypothetical protein
MGTVSHLSHSALQSAPEYREITSFLMGTVSHWSRSGAVPAARADSNVELIGGGLAARLPCLRRMSDRANPKTRAPRAPASPDKAGLKAELIARCAI